MISRSSINLPAVRHTRIELLLKGKVTRTGCASPFRPISGDTVESHCSTRMELSLRERIYSDLYFLHTPSLDLEAVDMKSLRRTILAPRWVRRHSAHHRRPEFSERDRDHSDRGAHRNSVRPPEHPRPTFGILGWCPRTPTRSIQSISR
jgi:hypothetical protein